MIRQLGILTLFIVLDGVQPGLAQPRSSPPASQTEIDQARQLNKGVEKLYSERKFEEAAPLAERALALREKALGPMHPDVAESLNSLALLYRDQGAYPKAKLLLVRALDIREKALGPMHPDVAASLNNLALLYQAQGAYGTAEQLYLRALDIREKVVGPMHSDVATSLNNLAGLYRAGGYVEAEPLYVRALNLREKVLGPMHPDVARSLNDLAGLYKDRGAYGKAEPLYARALDIREKVLGPMHPDVATSLNDLAGIYDTQGAYGRAEPLLVRALAIREKVLGPMHPELMTSLNSLGGHYREQGVYGKAAPLLVRALAIQEKVLGPMHPDVATSLNNLAELDHAQGAIRKAAPLLIRALAIREKVLGPMHPDVATSLHNLAFGYQVLGPRGAAEPYLIRALAIKEKVLGPMHPDVAASLHNLAFFYRAQKADGKVEPLLVRALAIREKGLGPMHPDVAQSLGSLARFYQAQGAYGRAEPLMSRAAEIQERQLRIELAPLSEPRKRILMTRMQGTTDSLVSLHADALPSSESALELALTTVVRRKGRILDSLIDNETTLRAHLTAPLRAQLDQLNQARTELVARLYAPMGPRSAADRAAITAARVHIDDLESALSAASAEFRVQSEPVTVAKIQAALPEDAALVEFVRYRRFDPRQTRQPWQADRYVAYLLMSHGPPQWVALGEAARIDAEVDAVLVSMDGKVPTEITKAALKRLDDWVFTPIRTRLTSVSHVILAPDGKLNLVPFEALLDTRGHYALENYLVSYVTTGRDLLRLAAAQPPRSSAVIVVSPDYGPLASPVVPGPMSFSPLAGAAAEVADLRRYFPTPLVGGNATKSALASLTGPAMLHIATHGFYARDPGPSATRAASPMPTPHAFPAPAPLAERDPLRGMFVDLDVSLRPPPRTEDPADALDRAGLAMAGANQGAHGIVTAREIAGFDLWGTQLVVLSACETGVGAVPSGDGVYGMRRALMLAGAESQVVSLWSVNDASTRALMRDYYDELARGTGRAEALRSAKLRLLRQPRYAHPYYWAAFIPAGDWRPLDKNTLAYQGPRP